MKGLEQNERRAAAADVPARVEAALAELYEQREQAWRLPTSTVEERVAKHERLALLAARQAGWWGVLRCWNRSHSELVSSAPW
ncbi:hypothetical protein BJF78_17335 [Pseudonocardia sp. CNS-139]|nr:hypothetical protein BJF78_17335 [Pseudonocardia sp. CNS-139]